MMLLIVSKQWDTQSYSLYQKNGVMYSIWLQYTREEVHVNTINYPSCFIFWQESDCVFVIKDQLIIFLSPAFFTMMSSQIPNDIYQTGELSAIFRKTFLFRLYPEIIILKILFDTEISVISRYYLRRSIL